MVHGTWANGWFKSKDAWFEVASPFAKSLLERLPENFELKSVYWSGANSVNARDVGAVKLVDQLRADASKNGDIEQIILAHSHGGTLAYEAIRKGAGTAIDDRVKGLICLGTPFVNFAFLPHERYWPGLAAIAGLFDSLLWTVVLTFFPKIIFNTNLLMVMVPIVTLLSIGLLALLVPRGKMDSSGGRGGQTPIPIYLLRATRDEASLSLGLMQTFNWLAAAFANRNEIGNLSYRKPLGIMSFAIVYLCSISGGFLTARWASKLLLINLDYDSFISMGLIYSFGIAGLFYFLGYASLAFSVGYFEIRRWPSTMIEVDAAPPGNFCKMKVYSSLNGFEGLRHGLYMSDEVVNDIAAVLLELAGLPTNRLDTKSLV
jgi:hypothetical protein